MNGLYEDRLTQSLENSRNCLRRIARNDETESSANSIMNIIEKFVKTVNVMDETILVPCRLMDLKVGDNQDPIKENHHTVFELLNSADLFQIYNMLKNVKDGLLWGGGKVNLQIESPQNNTLVGPLVVKGHVRRPSSISVTSTASSGLSDSESESINGNENDSGIDDVNECRPERIALSFQRHLIGLTVSLKQMTEAAQYLTRRYQHDIGGMV